MAESTPKEEAHDHVIKRESLVQFSGPALPRDGPGHVWAPGARIVRGAAPPRPPSLFWGVEGLLVCCGGPVAQAWHALALALAGEVRPARPIRLSPANRNASRRTWTKTNPHTQSPTPRSPTISTRLAPARMPPRVIGMEMTARHVDHAVEWCYKWGRTLLFLAKALLYLSTSSGGVESL